MQGEESECENRARSSGAVLLCVYLAFFEFVVFGEAVTDGLSEHRQDERDGYE